MQYCYLASFTRQVKLHMLMVEGHYYLGRGFEELDWNAWQTVIKSNGSYAEYGEMGD